MNLKKIAINILYTKIEFLHKSATYAVNDVPRQPTRL